LFLATGIALTWVAEAFPPDYFPSDFALYPTWPRFDARQAFSLLGVSALVLLAPKLLAYAASIVNARKRRAAGGGLALTNSVVLEILFSSLLAPVMMLMQTRFVLDILLGRDAGWAAQQRRGQDAPLGAIARQHLSHTLAGLALSLGTFSLSVQAWLWLLPVWLGLSLAIPLAWLTAQRGVGQGTRRAGLFLVADEVEQREPDGPLEEAVSS
jgi:membrane glycosyltransferase